MRWHQECRKLFKCREGVFILVFQSFFFQPFTCENFVALQFFSHKIVEKQFTFYIYYQYDIFTVITYHMKNLAFLAV